MGTVSSQSGGEEIGSLTNLPQNMRQIELNEMFLKSDIQADNSLELKEIIEWVESNQTALELFKRFQPPAQMKENFEVFRNFSKYSEDDANEMLKQINKANKDEYFYNEIGKLMSGKFPQAGYLSSTKSQQNAKNVQVVLPKISEKFQKQEKQMQLLQEEEQNELDMLDKVLDQHAKKYDSIKIKDDDDHQQHHGLSMNRSMPDLKDHKQHIKMTLHQQNQTFKHHVSKNIIIIKGNTLTRHEIFKLKDYFDQLSDGQQKIKIKEFTKSFSKKEKDHMKRVTASLFNFLDSKQLGEVSFEQLLLKLYPSLTEENISLINVWVKQYTKTFASESKDLIIDHKEEQKQSKRKRVLPITTLVRINEIFKNLDDQQKGYLTLDNLKTKYTYGFSQKEIEDLFIKHDQDKDGKLKVEDFIRMILPPDYVIEEKEDENREKN